MTMTRIAPTGQGRYKRAVQVSLEHRPSPDSQSRQPVQAASPDSPGYYLITHLLTRAVEQVEVDGHVFVDCKRVTHRSPWYVSVLGILASPFDLATLVRKSPAKRRASLSDMTVTAAQDSGISTGSSFALNQLAAPIQPVATQLPVAMHQPVAAHLPVVTQLPVATQLPASPVAPIQPGSSRSSVAPIQLASPVAPIQPGSPAAPFQPKQPGDIV